MRVFIERFVLAIFASLVLLLLTNPMGFSLSARINGIISIVILAGIAAYIAGRERSSWRHLSRSRWLWSILPAGLALALWVTPLIVGSSNPVIHPSLTEHVSDHDKYPHVPAYHPQLSLRKKTPVAVSKPSRILTGHTDAVTSVAFSPDGVFLATGSADHTIILYNTANNKIDHKFQVDAWVNSIAFSPDSALLAAGTTTFGSNQITVWDIANQHELVAMDGSISGWGGTSVVFSPYGHVLAWIDENLVRFTAVPGGTTLFTLIGADPPHAVAAIAYAPDGRSFATVDGNDIKLWDIDLENKIGRLRRTLTGHTATVASLVFSPDFSIVVSGSDDKTIKLWNVATGDEVCTLHGGHSLYIEDIAFVPNAHILASSSADRTINLWDLNTWGIIETITDIAGSIPSIAISPDGQILASASNGGRTMLWDVSKKVQEIGDEQGEPCHSTVRDNTVKMPSENEAAYPTTYLVFFDYEQASLIPESLTVIKEAFEYYRHAGKNLVITIIGHTDTAESDDKLAMARAENVSGALRDLRNPL